MNRDYRVVFFLSWVLFSLVLFATISSAQETTVDLEGKQRIAVPGESRPDGRRSEFSQSDDELAYEQGQVECEEYFCGKQRCNSLKSEKHSEEGSFGYLRRPGGRLIPLKTEHRKHLLFSYLHCQYLKNRDALALGLDPKALIRGKEDMESICPEIPSRKTVHFDSSVPEDNEEVPSEAEPMSAKAQRKFQHKKSRAAARNEVLTPEEEVKIKEKMMRKYPYNYRIALSEKDQEIEIIHRQIKKLESVIKTYRNPNFVKERENVEQLENQAEMLQRVMDELLDKKIGMKEQLKYLRSEAKDCRSNTKSRLLEQIAQKEQEEKQVKADLFETSVLLKTVVDDISAERETLGLQQKQRLESAQTALQYYVQRLRTLQPESSSSENSPPSSPRRGY